MKTRIRAYSKDYRCWLYGLYHFNKDWGVDIPEYRGLFNHTKSMIKLYNDELSLIINKPKASVFYGPDIK